MSRPLENNNWKAALMGYCAALLMALGMSLALLRAFAPRQALWPVIPICAGCTLVFHILFQEKFKGKLLLIAGAFAALGIWGLLDGGPVFSFVQMGKAAWLSFQGIPDALAPYAPTVRWVMCLLFSLLGAALYWDHTVPLAIFTVVSMVGIAFLFGEQSLLLLCALPAAAGILLMMSQDGKRLSALPVAAILTVLAFLLLPGQPKAVSPFKETAENIRQFIEDYLLFNEYRAAFTLTTEGFQPLDERLGGPAEPADHTVMEVKTDRTVLLRGKTYDEYTGLNWYDTLSSRRYLSVSPRYNALREELFDLNRPLSGDGGYSPETLRVHLLNQGTTTLFAPGRTRSLQLEGERMVLYYNTAGEYFLTRNVEAGDAYTLTYLPFTAGSGATEALVNACATLEDANYAEVARHYLQIPVHIQSEIYDLAQRVTANRATPYEKALALQNYLRRNYRYNLNVQVPPEGVDFVAWFLIGEQQGYCTYFASAMTLLCRIAGLPARYVTGYVAIPDDNGMALVTGENAHAWTEVYLNGFGWLAFDATPRTDLNPNDEPQDEPDRQQQPTPSPTPTQPPQSSPPPSEAPVETPTPAPTEQPQEQQQGDTPPTPTPIPPVNAPAPSPPPEGPEPEQQGRGSFPWWILLALLLLAALILRLYFTEPIRRAERHPEKATEILLTAVVGLLSFRGLQRQPQETLHDFAARADQRLMNARLTSIRPLTDAYAAQLYGRHRVNGLEYMGIYRTLKNAASPFARCMLAIRRVFSR